MASSSLAPGLKPGSMRMLAEPIRFNLTVAD